LSGPIPGIVASNWLLGSSRWRAISRFSNAASALPTQQAGLPAGRGSRTSAGTLSNPFEQRRHLSRPLRADDPELRRLTANGVRIPMMPAGHSD